MKRAQVIAISVAGAAALMAFYFASSFMTPPPAPIVEKQEVDSIPVLVAASDISIGQTVNDANFEWVSWPKAAVNASFITSKPMSRELAGSVARFALLHGEPITKNKLIKAGQGGVLAAILPGGMRAISTKIDAKSAAGNLILPNDHVDVILIRRSRGKTGQEDVVADTLFRNVRVIAIGQQIETKEGKKSAELGATTATLELTPRQAEMMALANAMGEITLTLRSVADLSTDPQASGGLNMEKDRGNSVRVLRYGAKSRVYGVN